MELGDGMDVFGLGLRGDTGKFYGSCRGNWLTGKKIERLDAEIILAHLLGITRAELYIYDKNVNNEIIDRFNALVEERASGRPLQYILGVAEFMGLEFKVTPDVFIPRPETELLVEEVIALCHPERSEGSIETDPSALPLPLRSAQGQGLRMTSKKRHNNDIRILDLGTGSGNIAIALTKFLPNCKIIISDISSHALAVAKENGRAFLVDKRIDFVQSDLFENLPEMKFDIIVSNPPYVASHEIGRLAKELGFEPRTALDGGPDGLDLCRRIINEAPGFLKDNGYLILEIGAGQDKGIEGLFAARGFKSIRFVEDYNKTKRVAAAQWIR